MTESRLYEANDRVRNLVFRSGRKEQTTDLPAGQLGTVVRGQSEFRRGDMVEICWDDDPTAGFMGEATWLLDGSRDAIAIELVEPASAHPMALEPGDRVEFVSSRCMEMAVPWGIRYRHQTPGQVAYGKPIRGTVSRVSPKGDAGIDWDSPETGERASRYAMGSSTLHYWPARDTVRVLDGE